MRTAYTRQILVHIEALQLDFLSVEQETAIRVESNVAEAKGGVVLIQFCTVGGEYMRANLI